MRLKTWLAGNLLEGNVVMDEPKNLTQAMCLLFSLIYELHIEYPEYIEKYLNCIQQVMLNLGRVELKLKILNLQNQLPNAELDRNGKSNVLYI